MLQQDFGNINILNYWSWKLLEKSLNFLVSEDEEPWLCIAADEASLYWVLLVYSSVTSASRVGLSMHLTSRPLFCGTWECVP